MPLLQFYLVIGKPSIQISALRLAMLL